MSRGGLPSSSVELIKRRGTSAIFNGQPARDQTRRARDSFERA
jgi:hypothetical protein